MIPLSSLITISEEGEAIGTLQQFACSFDLSMSRLLHVLETTARDCVIFQGGSPPNHLLILDDCGLPILFAGSAMASPAKGDGTASVSKASVQSNALPRVQWSKLLQGTSM